MSEAQNSLPASEAEPASLDGAPDHPSRLVDGARGDAWGEAGLDDGSGSGGHTLLSRPAAPQGRRSLFRR